MLKKLTKDQFKKVLAKKPLDCTENELRFVFNVLGFDLKEFGHEDGRLTFEIHYRCEYLMKAEIIDGVLVFSNQWRFNDEDEPYCSGRMFAGSLLDFIDTFFQTFGSSVIQPADYNPAWVEGWSAVDSVEEGREYWDVLADLGKAERIYDQHDKPLN